jgi:hypothetical protein
MRIRAVVTLALAALAVAVLMAMPAFAAKGGIDRPFKISGIQTGTFDSFNGDFELDGPAIASHLGKGSDQTFKRGSDERDIVTAANGDKLFATPGEELDPTGVVCPDVPGFFNFGEFTHAVAYSGGTGRFVNATGAGVAVNCLYFGAEIAPGVFRFYVTFSGTGTLSY